VGSDLNITGKNQKWNFVEAIKLIFIQFRLFWIPAFKKLTSSEQTVEIHPTETIYFFLCTFAATFNRSAFSRMKPVASSWLK